MAIIGPRPLLVRYLARYNEEQHHRHDVRPGLTYRNDPLENQVISEFRWVKIKRKSGSILLDNQQRWCI